MSSSTPNVFYIYSHDRFFKKLTYKYVQKINFCQSTFSLRVHSKRCDAGMVDIHLSRRFVLSIILKKIKYLRKIHILPGILFVLLANKTLGAN